MNPWSSHVQVWICSVSICSSAGEMTVTPLSHPSVAIWQPPIYINKAAVSHAIHQPFSFSYPYHVDVQNLQSVVCPIRNWKQIKNAGKMVEIACKWRYLSTGKLHGASVRASPGSCAFLWALAEFEACLRSPWPSWLPTLCHISCGWTHSAAGPARFRTEEVRSSSDHLSFPVNPLGSTSSPVPANTSRSYQFQGLGKVRSYFGMYVTLKSVANHEVIARTGWKNDFIWLFFFCHKKQIYSNWNCGKRDDFNRFSSLRKGYKSSKAISSLFFFFSWLEVWHCLFIYLLFNIEITFHS